VAEAYINRWTANRPDDIDNQIRMVQAMLRIPNSQSLKNWIIVDHLVNTGSDVVMQGDILFQFIEYITPLLNSDDAVHLARVVEIRDGNLRWIAFEKLLQLMGPPGLRLALESLPDAAVWGRWAGEVHPDGLARAATYMCGRPIRELGIPARDIMTEMLSADHIVVQALAIRCLGEIGNETTVAALEALQRNDTPVPGWAGGEFTEEGEPINKTIGQLATEAIEALQTEE
ncbi:MAG: HEAT repeat domain-containing protein, partial [Myxococcales bacterium]|nr:HEAT repeat domain-containing protein [Myxococcales bacterium]